MQSEIIIAAIAAFSAIAVALIQNRKHKKTLNDLATAKQGLIVAEKEIKIQSAVMDFASFIREWGMVYEESKKLIESTCIDRFLMLRAWNGSLDPRWTTAVLQMREGEQEPITYTHFELDDDYRQRLSMMAGARSIHFKVSDLPDCSIKSVYEAEGVKYALWIDIYKESFEDGTAAHTYASFATHEDIEFDQATITKCEIMAGRLKGVALSFADH